MKTEKISEIESCAADSIPVKHLEIYDGWRLRFNDGVTRRANSVLAERHGSIGLEQKLAYIEKFYRNYNSPARFQLSKASKPSALAEVLLQRGYSKTVGAKVQVASLAALTNQKQKHKIVILKHASPEWLKVYEEVEKPDKATSKIRQEMFSLIPQQRGFALAFIGEKAVAIGLTVLIRNQLGLFNMATIPQMRRQGLARSIVYRLADWAIEREAKNIYLQVTGGNIGAQKAYEKMGFVTAYEYEYYTKS